MMRRVDKFNESIEYVQNQMEVDTNTISIAAHGSGF
jgi:uridine phosphorylase